MFYLLSAIQPCFLMLKTTIIISSIYVLISHLSIFLWTKTNIHIHCLLMLVLFKKEKKKKEKKEKKKKKKKKKKGMVDGISACGV